MAVISVCTSCGYKQPIQAGLQDAKSRNALVACLRLAPSLTDRILMYLELFSPGERAIRSDKLSNILIELSEQIATATISANGNTFSAPLEVWKMGFDSVAANRSTLSLPLKTHGYLFKTVANLANSAAGKAEAKREQQRQQASTSSRNNNRTDVPKSVISTLNNKAENASRFKDAATALIKNSEKTQPQKGDKSL